MYVILSTMQNYAHTETKTNTILINNANIPLYDDFLLPVHRAELVRSHPFAGFEDAVEIRQIVESAGIADLRDVGGGVHKGSGRVAEPYINQIGGQSLACAEPEEAAERARAHPHEACQLREGHLLGVMLVDIFLDLHHPTAFGVSRRVGERAAGQFFGVAAGKDVKQLEAAHELHEAVFLVDHGVDLGICLHDGAERKRKSMARPVQHPPDACELVSLKDSAIEEIGRELDCYLPDVRRLARTLLPHVLQILAGDQDKVIVPYRLDAVPDDAAHPGGVLDEIQLILPVTVQRVGEFLLVPLHDVETVPLRQP